MHTGWYGEWILKKEGNLAKRNPDMTRRSLLEAAFGEIHIRGFQAASLDRILSRAGVTKGALYHHFQNKRQLGYAVVDDLILERVVETWVRPLERAQNPIDGLLAALGREREEPAMDRLGCPLNNLSQEMSPLDEGFRERLENVFRVWLEGIADCLRRGQAAGQVRTDIDPSEVATFFLASLEGCISLAKNAGDKRVFENCTSGLQKYLEGLRVVTGTPSDPPSPAVALKPSE